jgi:hypothetical protein
VRTVSVQYVSYLRKWTAPTPRFIGALLWLSIGIWNWNWLGPAWIAAMRPDPHHIIDFYQDWASAHNYWSGHPIYTPHSISIPRYLGLSSNPMPGIEFNIHPPTSVLVALPLGRLNYPDAVLVWNVISLLALLASLVIVTINLPESKFLILLGLPLLPLCHPVYGNLYQGQLNLVLVLFVTGMWVLERAGRSHLAGLLLGVAAAIKLYPIYLGVYFAAQRRYRLLLIALASFLTLNFITALVLGPHTYHDYVEIVLPWNAEFRLLGYNLSIAGLWHKLFYPVAGEKIVPLWSSLALARWGTLLSNLIITIVVAIVSSKARIPTQRSLAFAITAIAMLLVSPVTWDISLPILLVPFVLIAQSPIIARSPWLLAGLVLVLVVDCTPQTIITELMSGNRFMNEYSWRFMLGAPSLKFYTLLGTFLLGLIACWFEAVKPQLDPVTRDI